MTLKRSGRSEHYLNGCKLQRLSQNGKFINFYVLPAFPQWTIQSQKYRKKLITYINHFIESLINYNFTIYKLNWSHQQFLQTNFLMETTTSWSYSNDKVGALSTTTRTDCNLAGD